jgi:hypothetical protein
LGIIKAGEVQGEQLGWIWLALRSCWSWRSISLVSWGAEQYKGELGRKTLGMRSIECSIECCDGRPFGGENTSKNSKRTTYISGEMDWGV